MKINQLFGRGSTVAWRLLSALALFGTLPVVLADPVPWWSQRGVLTPNIPANDYAAANLGQLKNIAQAAAAELNAKLPGGAGTNINNLITSWQQPPASGVTRNDYAAVNLGQLKAIAKPFYDRLYEVGYNRQPLMAGQKYPWDNSLTPVNDYALANLGQLKQVFAFELLGDTDNNQLPDWWELSYFGHVGIDPNGDEDGDGLSNLDEYRIGTNPVSADTDGDGLDDGYEIAHGNVATYATAGFNPLVFDSGFDADGDGSSNLREYLGGTDPLAPSAEPPPNAPGGVVLVKNADGSIDMSWEDRSDNEDCFTIRLRNKTTGAMDILGTVPANTTSVHINPDRTLAQP